MGVTGIETAEIIRGVVAHTRPRAVLAVDALAARQASRMNATIQLSDTGIHPGAGMGNRRAAINAETMGVPVIALGVPTVVDAATLVNDALDTVLEALQRAAGPGKGFYEALEGLESQEKYRLLSELLPGNLFVTPKEVDAVIERLSNIIANGINLALHPGIGPEDINRYIY
jgi:spore protease